MNVFTLRSAAARVRGWALLTGFLVAFAPSCKKREEASASSDQTVKQLGAENEALKRQLAEAQRESAPKSKPTAAAPRTEDPLTNEAIEKAWALFKQHWKPCNDTFVSLMAPQQGLLGHDLSIHQLKDAELAVERPEALTAADRLNGVSWKGFIRLKFAAQRVASGGALRALQRLNAAGDHAPASAWGPWEPQGQYGDGFVLLKKNDVWEQHEVRTDNFLMDPSYPLDKQYTPVPCERIQSDGTFKATDGETVVDITTGDLYSLASSPLPEMWVSPLVSPDTGKRTLLPVLKGDDGAWAISPRHYLQLLGLVEGEPKALMDHQSGRVRVTNDTPKRIN